MLSETKRYNIQVEGSREEGDVKLVEKPDGNLVYFYEAELKVDYLNTQIAMLQRRLAEMGETEIDLHTKIIQLEDEARGPAPHATWKDAAISERNKRYEHTKEIRELKKRDDEARYLVARWIEPKEKHNWDGFQAQVEKFLGVNQPEPIPKNVRWDESMDDFYDTFYDFRSMGKNFREAWIDRKSEFTTMRNLVGTWP